MTLPNGDETKQEPQTQPAGQPAEPGQSQTPEYVTKEQLESMMGELKNTFNEAYRGVQSNNDRALSRMQQLRQDIANDLADLQRRGVQLTDQQIEQISRDRALDSMFVQPPAEPGNVPGQGQPAPAGQSENGQSAEPTHWVDAAVGDLVTKFGFDIDEGDPEYQELQTKTNDPDPNNFYEAYRQALNTKAERQQKQVPARTPAMVTGSTPPSNEIANITDPDELFELARKAGKI